MKIRFLKLQSWVLVSLLWLLGFGGCRSTKEFEGFKGFKGFKESEGFEGFEGQVGMRSEIALMYGVPTANFHIKGRVVDADSIPIKGIQLLRLEHGMEATSGGIVGDSTAIERYTKEKAVVSSADGSFAVSFSDRPFDEVRLLVRDVDGEANGSYNNSIFSVTVKPEDFKGGSGWDRGTVTKEVTIRMEAHE